MSAITFLCLLAGLAVVWSCLWVYMLCNVLSDDLEKIKKQLAELNAEFTHYRINNPPRD